MSMTEFHRRVLEKVAPDLLNDLNSDDIVRQLLGDEAITRQDHEEIDSKETRSKKVAALLDILPRRGDGAYISFQNSLTKTDGSMHLYETMKKHEQWVYDRLQEEMEEEEKRPIQDAKQPKKPDKVLQDPDLLELAPKLGEYWEMLALELQMSKAVIYQCKENNRNNNVSQIFDMLYKWKCRQGKKATVSVMLEACKKINLLGLGEDAYDFLYEL